VSEIAADTLKVIAEVSGIGLGRQVLHRGRANSEDIEKALRAFNKNCQCRLWLIELHGVWEQSCVEDDARSIQLSSLEVNTQTDEALAETR
jgi:hypothetical protein